ncbi:MAG: ComF family protein [Bacteroidota bacterium]
MKLISPLIEDALHLFYPHLCYGCGTDLIEKHQLICSPCVFELPKTNFESIENNAVEKLFTGRLFLKAAYCEFYFSKGHTLQHLIHELKYKGNTEIGFFLGELMGHSILNSERFGDIDFIVPLPMFTDKEKKRGYNQAEVLSKGIGKIIERPVKNNLISRNRATETQTRKHRTERWLNVDGSFVLNDPDAFIGKKILLVDDVITTGATLEACGNLILQMPNTNLYIAALAQAIK